MITSDKSSLFLKLCRSSLRTAANASKQTKDRPAQSYSLSFEVISIYKNRSTQSKVERVSTLEEILARIAIFHEDIRKSKSNIRTYKDLIHKVYCLHVHLDGRQISSLAYIEMAKSNFQDMQDINPEQLAWLSIDTQVLIYNLWVCRGKKRDQEFEKKTENLKLANVLSNALEQPSKVYLLLFFGKNTEYSTPNNNIYKLVKCAETGRYSFPVIDSQSDLNRLPVQVSPPPPGVVDVRRLIRPVMKSSSEEEMVYRGGRGESDGDGIDRWEGQREREVEARPRIEDGLVDWKGREEKENQGKGSRNPYNPRERDVESKPQIVEEYADRKEREVEGNRDTEGEYIESKEMEGVMRKRYPSVNDYKQTANMRTIHIDDCYGSLNRSGVKERVEWKAKDEFEVEDSSDEDSMIERVFDKAVPLQMRSKVTVKNRKQSAVESTMNKSVGTLRYPVRDRIANNEEEEEDERYGWTKSIIVRLVILLEEKK